MGKALLIVNHKVTEYDKWRTVYDEVEPLREKHHFTGASVLQSPTDREDVTVLHWFPTVADAEGFAQDPELKDAMGRAGVSGPPRIEISVEA